MRVYAKKSLLFVNPDANALESDKEFAIKYGETSDAPDWIKGTPLFNLATKTDDADLLVIDDAKSKTKPSDK